ncbi:MAG: alpha/beta hydrolase [Nitriliruptoraceae bacterium]
MLDGGIAMQMETVDWSERCVRWAGIRSDTIDVYGKSVHVLRAGDPDSGTPQLFIHGLGGSSTNWLEVAAAFAERGPVLAVDLPGFGRTQPPRTTAARLSVNAKFLHAVVRTQGWPRVQIHGNSMGGTLAVLLAAMLGDQVERLVLVAAALPSSRRDTSKLDPVTFRRFAPFVVPPLGSALLRKMYRAKPVEQLWSDNAAYIHADPSRLSPEIIELGLENLRSGLAQSWRLPSLAAAATSTVAALLGRRKLFEAMTAITAPTVYVWGQRDRLVGLPVIDMVRRRRPDWQIVELPDVGHVPMLESPHAYIEAVTSWLDASS